MANKAINPAKILRPNTITEVEKISAVTGDVLVIPVTGKGHRIDFRLKCGTTAGNITVKSGDSWQASNDLTIALEAGKEYAFVLDTGYFLNTTGENKGKILIETEVAIAEASVVDIEL